MISFGPTRTPGFTLVEVLVYLAILMVVSVSSVSLLLSLNGLIKQYRVETALYRSSTNVLEPIILELRRGEQFDLVNSIIEDSATGKVVIQSGATTTEFAKVGDDLELTINGENYGDLLNEGVVVTGFTVYRHTTAIGTLIRVRLELSATADSTTKEIDVYGGAVIRGDL